MSEYLKQLCEDAEISETATLPGVSDVPEICENCYCYSECAGW